MFEEEEEEPDAEDEQAAVPANPLASMLAAYEDSGEEEAAYDEADEMARVRQENEQAFGADSDAEKDDASAGASHSAPDPQEEDNLEEWDGTVPPDAHPIAVELHCKISLVFGQNLAGGEPDWGAASDYGAFESDEAMRYGFNGEDVHLDKTPFDVFAEHGHEGTAEYKAPYTHKKEGILFPKLGTSGEKYGEWDAFTLFHPVPASGTSLEKVEFAQEVNVGPAFPDGEVGIVLRILRGTKAAGRAADAKTQLCYLVLLLVGKKLKYAALQHIGPTDWTKGDGYHREEPGIGTHRVESALQNWVPKKAAAASKEASQYVKALYREVQEESDESDESEGGRPPQKRQRARHSK